MLNINQFMSLRAKRGNPVFKSGLPRLARNDIVKRMTRYFTPSARSPEVIVPNNSRIAMKNIV